MFDTHIDQAGRERGWRWTEPEEPSLDHQEVVGAAVESLPRESQTGPLARGLYNIGVVDIHKGIGAVVGYAVVAAAAVAVVVAEIVKRQTSSWASKKSRKDELLVRRSNLRGVMVVQLGGNQGTEVKDMEVRSPQAMSLLKSCLCYVERARRSLADC